MTKVAEYERKQARALVEDLSRDGDSDGLLACLEMEPFDSARELRLRAVRAALAVMRAQADKEGLLAALSDDRLIGDRWFEREVFHTVLEQLTDEGDAEGLLALLDEPLVEHSAKRRARVVYALHHRQARNKPRIAEKCGAEWITRLCDYLRRIRIPRFDSKRQRPWSNAPTRLPLRYS
jgi:hypothetical protein